MEIHDKASDDERGLGEPTGSFTKIFVKIGSMLNGYLIGGYFWLQDPQKTFGGSFGWSKISQILGYVLILVLVMKGG